jgi:hypothetical protein
MSPRLQITPETLIRPKVLLSPPLRCHAKPRHPRPRFPRLDLDRRSFRAWRHRLGHPSCPNRPCLPRPLGRRWFRGRLSRQRLLGVNRLRSSRSQWRSLIQWRFDRSTRSKGFPCLRRTVPRPHRGGTLATRLPIQPLPLQWPFRASAILVGRFDHPIRRRFRTSSSGTSRCLDR